MKNNESKCHTPYCRNNKCSGSNYCHKCNKRKYKEKHPEAYCYNTLRQNAKRRDHIFELTLEQFIEFCNDTNYMKLKGKTATSASIDRKKPYLGYVHGNLQLLSLSANSKKRFEDESDYPF